MSRQVGIVLGMDCVRGVVAARIRGRIRVDAVAAVPFSGSEPVDEVLRELHRRLEPERALPVGLAPPPADSWLKLLPLPPATAADRARMVELEAERFFPVRGEAVVVDVPAQGPVAAAHAAALEAWVARVEEGFGPVRAVEPAARGLVRAFAALDRGLRKRVFAVLLADGRWWDMAIARDGVLLGHARFLAPEPASLADALAVATEPAGMLPRVIVAGADARDATAVTAALEVRLPGIAVETRDEIAPGVPVAYAPALGLAVSAPGGLLPVAHRARQAGAARRQTAAWALGAMLSVLLFFGAGMLAGRRGAADREAEAARLRPRADSAAVLLEGAHRVGTLIAFTDSVNAAGIDWVGVLAELSRHLPAGAYLTQVQGRADSRTLQVRGYAGNASAIVPLLERSPRFANVESTEPISRRTVGDVELENFHLRLEVEK